MVSQRLHDNLYAIMWMHGHMHCSDHMLTYGITYGICYMGTFGWLPRGFTIMCYTHHNHPKFSDPHAP